jgi:hypothetical protein
MMDDDTNVLEETLARSLTAMVDGHEPSPELREQVADGILAAPQSSRRRFVPMAAAAAVLAIALLGAVIARDGGGDDMDVATDPSPTTTEAPQVLGDQVTRTPTETTTDTVAESTTTTTAAAVATTVAPAPAETAPPTTALVCQFSTDPACGPFYWEPAPVNQPATLTVTAPDDVVAGEQVRLSIAMTDDGRVTLDCVSVSLSPDTGLSTGSCVYEKVECPARYGPWSPVPQSGEAETHTVVSFDEPGTYEVTVVVQAAQGCDNVDPYRSGASTTITVEVGPAPAA